MSYIKTQQFQSSEDTTKTKKKIKKVVRRITTRNDPVFEQRQEKYDRHAHAATYSQNSIEIFRENAKITDSIDIIPGMTKGLLFVLNSLDIFYVSQLLAELIKRVDDMQTDQEILQQYYNWLKSITKDTIASETNLHTITYAIGNFTADRGLFFSEFF